MRFTLSSWKFTVVTVTAALSTTAPRHVLCQQPDRRDSAASGRPPKVDVYYPHFTEAELASEGGIIRTQVAPTEAPAALPVSKPYGGCGTTPQNSNANRKENSSRCLQNSNLFNRLRSHRSNKLLKKKQLTQGQVYRDRKVDERFT